MFGKKSVISEETLSLLDSLDSYVVLLDRNGRIAYANKFFLSATGLVNSSLVGSEWHADVPIVTKWGFELSVEWSSSPITEKGKPAGTLLIGVEAFKYKALKKDLSDQKAAKERETSTPDEMYARLLAAINSVPSGFIITDSVGDVVMVNNALSDVLNAKHPQWSLAIVQKYLGKGIDLNNTVETCVKERRPIVVKEISIGSRYLKLYVSPIFLVKKTIHIIGCMIIIENITEAKAIERSREEFFSIASHELRTPLTSIRGNAEILRTQYVPAMLDDSLKETVEYIYSSSVRLIDIVNEFLNTSKLEQGKIEFKKEQFDIVELITDVIKELQLAAQKKKLVINVKSAPDCPSAVLADRNKTREVLVNLIGNAVNFTDTGSILVSVRKDNQLIKVSVSDTGKGIAVGNRSLLFRKFQQAGTSLYARDISRSTGLGLYVSKLMVEGMGGRIFLEKSEEGVGSVFTFTLPIV